VCWKKECRIWLPYHSVRFSAIKTLLCSCVVGNIRTKNPSPASWHHKTLHTVS
jgi:hypothetical protein